MAGLARGKEGTLECLLYEQYVFDVIFSILPNAMGIIFPISWVTEVHRSLRITISVSSQKYSCEVRFCSKKIRVSYYVPLEEKSINSYQMVVTIIIKISKIY